MFSKLGSNGLGFSKQGMQPYFLPANVFNKLTTFSKLKMCLLASGALVGSLLVTTPANAKSRHEIGDVVGKWQVFSKKSNEKLFSVAIRYDAATNTYIGKIDSLGKRLTQLKVCKVCRGKLKNQSLLGVDVLQGVKPKLDKQWQFTGSYDGGKMLDPLTGEVNSVTLSVSSSKRILKAQRHVSKYKRVGVTDMWMRLK